MIVKHLRNDHIPKDFPWIGQEVKCHHCGSTLTLQKGDAVTRTTTQSRQLGSKPVSIIKLNCKNCKADIKTNERSQAAADKANAKKVTRATK